jgi:hypothetical protein
MRHEDFITRQRKAMNRVLVLFVGLLGIMWIATVLDKAFNLGWDWDRQILWLAPMMVLFAAILRFWALAIFKFVGRNY